MGLETSDSKPQDAFRGDIWEVDLRPIVGSEIDKPRPCVIINADGLKTLPVKLVVPLTEWKKHKEFWWCIAVEPTIKNGLGKKSLADVSHTRSVSIERFVKKKGFVSAEIVEEIVAALAAFVDYSG